MSLEQIFATACFIGLLAFWRLWVHERKRNRNLESLHYLSRIGQHFPKPIEDFDSPILIERVSQSWWDAALELARREQKISKNGA